MAELDVPAMIHVSGACHHSLDTTSSYYLGADTTAFTQLMFSDVFKDFPSLKIIIPHGGGAVPYHWGRFRGIAQDKGLGDRALLVLQNIFFDTRTHPWWLSIQTILILFIMKMTWKKWFNTFASLFRALNFLTRFQKLNDKMGAAGNNCLSPVQIGRPTPFHF